MRTQDMILLVCSFSAMALGVFMPFIGAPLAWFPRVSMLCMLFICFLGVDGLDAWQNLTHYPLLVFLLVFLKLIVMPIVCWGIVYLVIPEYAISAALVGGAATAVAAPFFAFMVQADVVLVMVSLVTTSLLLPITLPLVLAFIGRLAQVEGGIQVELPVLSMILSLSTMIVIPFAGAQLLRRIGPTLSKAIFDFRQYLFLSTSSLTMMIIFAQYSSVILQSPQSVFLTFICAMATGLFVFVFVATVTFWLPPVKQLAFIISCVAVNNVVVLIMAVDFFDVPEALVTAMYCGVLFSVLPLYRMLGKLRGYDPK